MSTPNAPRGADGLWVIEAIGPRGSAYWEAGWEVGDRTRADRKIWHVTYRRIARDQPTRAAAPDDLVSLKRELDAALIEIQEYATAHGLENFATVFERS